MKVASIRLTMVRISGPGVRAMKFPTECAPEDITERLEDALDGVGLEMDDDGEIFGTLQHPSSMWLTVRVRGEATYHRADREYEIELETAARLQWWIFLLCFMFPPLFLLFIVYSLNPRMFDGSGTDTLNAALATMRDDLRVLR